MRSIQLCHVHFCLFCSIEASVVATYHNSIKLETSCKIVHRRVYFTIIFGFLPRKSKKASK